MKISVVASPGKKKARVEKLAPNTYAVSVKEPAKDGRANWAIIETLAEYFGIAKSRIRMITGFKSKMKVFEVPENTDKIERDIGQKKLF